MAGSLPGAGIWLLAIFMFACQANNSPGPDLQSSPDNTVHPIVDATHGQLFGATAGSRWLSGEEAVQYLGSGESYRLYSLTSFWGQQPGGPPEPPQETCSNPTVRIEAVPESRRDITAVGADWDALPRLPAVEDGRQPAYRQAVAGRLRAHGISEQEVNITEVLRIDLDGDGTEETLISASQRRGLGTSAKVGDYAMLLISKAIKDRVEIIPLEEEYYPAGCIMECAPAEYHVTAVLDVNGDGLMEIIVGFDYYEGKGKAIYTLEANQPHKRLFWICGV